MRGFDDLVIDKGRRVSELLVMLLETETGWLEVVERLVKDRKVLGEMLVTLFETEMEWLSVVVEWLVRDLRELGEMLVTVFETETEWLDVVEWLGESCEKGF